MSDTQTFNSIANSTLVAFSFVCDLDRNAHRRKTDNQLQLALIYLHFMHLKAAAVS